MWKHWQMIGLCLIWPALCIAQEVDDHWLKQGIEQEKQGAHQQAITSFGQFIQQYPTELPQAYFYRGSIFFHQKEYQAALLDFQQLTQLLPNHAEGIYALGRTHYQLSDYQQAKAAFSQAIALDPHYAVAYNERGLVWCQLREFDLALADFYQATRLDTSFALACNNAGVARYFNQDIAKPTRKDLAIAHRWFSQAIEQDPTLALAYRNRATMSILLKQYPAALADLHKAAKRSPDDALVFFYYGVAYADLGSGDKALQAFEECLRRKPDLAVAYEEIGNLYKSQVQFTLAIQNYQFAQTMPPGGEALYAGLMDYRIALVYAQQNRSREMYAALKRARKAGAFSDMRVYQDCLTAEEFKPYQQEKAFRRFLKRIQKGEKTNKFLQPALTWFRMRKE